MTNQIYKFDTKTKKGLYFAFSILGVFTLSVWLGIPTYYRWGHLSLMDCFSRPILGFIASMAIVFALCWNSYKTRFQYEPSTAEVIMRSGNRVLKRIPLSSVKGFFAERGIICLEVDKRDNLKFYGIYGSMRDRLIVALRELGITPIT